MSDTALSTSPHSRAPCARDRHVSDGRRTLALVVLDDEDAYWKRLYGLDRPLTNERAWSNFGRFTIVAIGAMATLFGVVVLVAWLTS